MWYRRGGEVSDRRWRNVLGVHKTNPGIDRSHLARWAEQLGGGELNFSSDIDLVYLNGYGFPLRRGGPMLHADLVGLPNVVRALRRFAAEPGADAFWQPAPLLVKLAEEGRGS